MREGQLPPLPHPLHLCAYAGEKGSKMLHKGEQLLYGILLILHVNMDKHEREKSQSRDGGGSMDLHTPDT